MHKLTIALLLLATSFRTFVSSAGLPIAQSVSLPVPDIATKTRNSTLSDQGPQHVEVEANDLGKNLQPIACLVNSVRILGELALEDYEGTIDRPRLFRYTSFPEVFFGVVPTDGVDLPRSVVLWGLSKAVTWQSTRFQEARFGLLWKGKWVGFIYFRNQELPRPSSTLRVSTPHQTGNQFIEDDFIASPQISVSNTIDNPRVNNTSLATAPLKLGMTQLLHSLPFEAVVGVVMAGIVQAAPFKSTDIVVGDPSLGIAPLRVMVVFQHAKPARTRPPYFRYEHMIRAMTDAPVFMAMAGRWGELKIDLEVGHSLVGTGYILKDPNLSLAEEGAGWAVS